VDFEARSPLANSGSKLAGPRVGAVLSSGAGRSESSWHAVGRGGNPWTGRAGPGGSGGRRAHGRRSAGLAYAVMWLLLLLLIASPVRRVAVAAAFQQAVNCPSIISSQLRQRQGSCVRRCGCKDSRTKLQRPADPPRAEPGAGARTRERESRRRVAPDLVPRLH